MAEKINRVYGEARVDLGAGVSGTVGTSQQATAEHLVALAKKIWKEVKASGAKDDAGQDALLRQLQEKYKDFAISFPIPLRLMVQAHDFHAESFKKFLTTHVKSMYKDRMEFLEAQAEYMVLVFRARHPRAPPKAITRYREEIRKQLKADNEDFTQSQKEAEEEVRRLDAEVDAERRQRLFEFLRRQKLAGEGAGKPAPPE